MRSFCQLFYCTLLLTAGLAWSTPSHAAYNADNYVNGLKEMTKELVNVIMEHTFIIGTFFDADQTIDTQLEYQRLQAEAHKDYHPSTGMCKVGSFVRSVARTEHKANADRIVLNALLMDDITSPLGSDTSYAPDTYLQARIDHFKENYCDPADNNGALADMCKHDNGVGATDKNRINNDIDYTKTLATKLTLDINFTDDTPEPTKNEDDLTMLARNLYWPEALSTVNADTAKKQEYVRHYLRSIIAPQAIAIDSFTALASQKFSADPGEGATSGWNYMKAMLKEFGVKEDDIHATLGDYPSYYAQMDVLTKQMLQNPDFYTDLYDKPANVERIDAALQAVQLMNMRDYYQSKTRQEMLLSTILQQQLNTSIENTRTQLLYTDLRDNSFGL